MEGIEILAHEWLGAMASRVRKSKFYCEPNSTPQRPIEPHEMSVKKFHLTGKIYNIPN